MIFGLRLDNTSFISTKNYRFIAREITEKPLCSSNFDFLIQPAQKDRPILLAKTCSTRGVLVVRFTNELREFAMLSNRLLSIILLSVFAFANIGVSQLHTPGARFGHLGLESADATRPAATPGIFDYDAQIFSPVEFPDGEQLPPKCGFFFTIDKLYSSISGDGAADGGAGDNYIWGTRYEGGYMNTEDDGWQAVFERSEGNEFLNGANVLNPNPTLYEANFATVEINKVFRQRLNRGGWIEPYIGLRYFGHSDSTLEDIGPGLAGGVTGNRFTQRVTNNAFGLNIGGRLVKRRGKFRFSHDLALAPMYNQQRFRANDLTDNFGVLVVNEIGDSGNAFVPSIDYRFEVAYNLTRDFGIRGGASINYLWDGVARANTAGTFTNPNSILGVGTGPAGLFEDDLAAAGFSFGLEYRS